MGSLKQMHEGIACPRFGKDEEGEVASAIPVKLTKRSEADKDAYFAGKILEANAEIARLKLEVGRLTLENAELRAIDLTRPLDVRPQSNPLDTRDHVATLFDKKAYQRELMRKRRAAAKEAKS